MCSACSKNEVPWLCHVLSFMFYFHVHLVCSSDNSIECMELLRTRCNRQTFTVIKTIRLRMPTVEKVVNSTNHSNMKVSMIEKGTSHRKFSLLCIHRHLIHRPIKSAIVSLDCMMFLDKPNINTNILHWWANEMRNILFVRCFIGNWAKAVCCPRA